MSLENSQALSWLLDEANKTTDLNKTEVLYLLKLIHAPINLLLLFQVLKNLPFVLATAKVVYQMDQDLFPEIDFDSASNVCEKLIFAEAGLLKCSSLTHLFSDPDKTIWGQLHGILQSHPLYSCLCFQPEGNDAVAIYQHLLAQVFLASQKLDADGIKLPGLMENYFSVRSLCQKKSKKQILSLPSQALPALEFLALTKRPKTNTHIRNAGLILQRAYHGARRSKKKSKGLSGQKLKGRVSTSDLEDYEHPEDLLSGQDEASPGILTKRRAKHYAKHGGSASEFPGGTDEVPVALPDQKGYSGPTLQELAFQAKQRSNQLAMKNQFNPLGWNELNEYDLHILLKFFHSEAGNTTEKEASKLVDLLSLMFWLSAPLERVLVLDKINGHPSEGSEEGLYRVAGKALVAKLHSPGPPLESDSLNTTSKHAVPVSYYSHVPLPLIAHTKNLLESFDNASSIEPSLPSADMSEGDVNTIKKKLKAVLSNLNKEFGTRLSLGRISHYWLHAVGMEAGGDTPSSLLYFGHLEKFSVARMHYTCASAQSVETTYRRLCTNLLCNLKLPSTFPDAPQINTGIYLGTPFCPKVESVQDLVKSLLNAVEQSRTSKKNIGSIRNFHNHYAVYTACLIAFSTTFRAVQNPSLPEKDIDFTTGLGVISDKDDATFYHSRFVWIPQVCRQQIINYRRHLQRLYELLALQNPVLLSLFKDSDHLGRPLKLFFWPRNNTSLKILRPGLLGDILKNGHKYDLPVNAHRHYFKNELLKSGCSIDVLEGQLGHWEQGQEPWNRFSNFHPREFVRQLDLHLTPILERDGWKAIDGYEP